MYMELLISTCKKVSTCSQQMDRHDNKDTNKLAPNEDSQHECPFEMYYFGHPLFLNYLFVAVSCLVRTYLWNGIEMCKTNSEIYIF